MARRKKIEDVESSIVTHQSPKIIEKFVKVLPETLGVYHQPNGNFISVLRRGQNVKISNTAVDDKGEEWGEVRVPNSNESGWIRLKYCKIK